MSKRLLAGVTAAVASVALAVPAAGVANKGGVPHKTPTSCKAHKHVGKHNGATKGKKKGAAKGNKCGK